MGLGLLGKGIGDARFLAECGADLIITDLKSEKELESSVKALKKYKNIKFTLGEHKFSDFENRDFILKAQGVPLYSPYIAHAKKNGIHVYMDDSLFSIIVSDFNPKVKIIGVTGTRGKTTVASIVYHVLKSAKKRVHLGGNIRGIATLELLKKVKPGDIVVLELSSWQLQGFAEEKISPSISVFTNFMQDHLNYYGFGQLTKAEAMKKYFEDKSNIFKFQNEKDILVTNDKVAKKISKNYKGNIIIPKSNFIPKNWKPSIEGDHNLLNIAQAVAVLKSLKIPLSQIKKGVESFKAVTGRLQYVKEIKGIKIYNDNNSTTPEATISALNSFSGKNIVLIMGGADKGLDLSLLKKTIIKKTKKIVLLAGTGTFKLGKLPNSIEVNSLKEAIYFAFKEAKKGDIILFSPAFASFGKPPYGFKNEYERNDLFLDIIKKIK